MVTVTSEDGDTNAYVFILKRQSDGEFKGCWMTDCVVGVRPGDEVPSTQPEEKTDEGVLRSSGPVSCLLPGDAKLNVVAMPASG